MEVNCNRAECKCSRNSIYSSECTLSFSNEVSCCNSGISRLTLNIHCSWFTGCIGVGIETWSFTVQYVRYSSGWSSDVLL